MPTTADKIRSFIVSNFYVAGSRRFDDDTSLLEEGIIDSTGVLEILGFVEQEFGVTAADEEILPENLDGIARIAAFVESKLAAGAGRVRAEASAG